MSNLIPAEQSALRRWLHQVASRIATSGLGVPFLSAAIPAPSAARLRGTNAELTVTEGGVLYLTHRGTSESRSAHLRRYHIAAPNRSLLPFRGKFRVVQRPR